MQATFPSLWTEALLSPINVLPGERKCGAADVGSCKCVAGPAKVWCGCLKGLLEQFSLSCTVQSRVQGREIF